MVIFPYRDCQLSTLPSAEGGGGGGEWQFLSPLWNSGKFMLVPAGKRETEKVLDFFFFFGGFVVGRGGKERGKAERGEIAAPVGEAPGGKISPSGHWQWEWLYWTGAVDNVFGGI